MICRKARTSKEIPSTTKLVRTLKKLVRGVLHKNYPFSIVVYKGELENPNLVYFNIDKRKVFDIGHSDDCIGYLFELSMSHNVTRIEVTDDWKFLAVNLISLELTPSPNGKTNINDWFLTTTYKLLGGAI